MSDTSSPTDFMNLQLFPKQYAALTTEANEILYGGAAGSGKALALFTPLLTANRGWQTMESVEVGDLVFDETGWPTQVVAKSEVIQERTFRLWFDGHITIVAGENHDWGTQTVAERAANDMHAPARPVPYRLRNTLEIFETQITEDGNPNHTIHKAKPLRREETESSVDSKEDDSAYWQITAVEEIPSVPLQCIQVDSESHMYLAGEHLIPTHNSFLLRYVAIMYAFAIPQLSIFIFRRKYSELMQNHMWGPNGFVALLDPWVQSGRISINMSDRRIDFKHEGGGVSQIFLRHIQHESDVYLYQGAEIHVLLLDEATHISGSMYKFLRTRVRSGGLRIDHNEVKKRVPFYREGKIPFILSATNPGGVGASFFKKSFVDPAPPNMIWDAPAKEGGMSRVFIPAFLSDNPVIIEEDPFYADRLLGIGGSWAKRLLEGSWDIIDGGAVSDVWDHEVHVLPQLVIPLNASIFRALDWGTFHPSVVLYALKATGELLHTVTGEELLIPKGSIIIVHEIYNWDGEDENAGNRKPATEVGRQIAEFESQVPWRGRIKAGPADRQIFQQRGGTHDTIDNLIRAGYNGYMEEVSKQDRSFHWQYNKRTLFEMADQSTGSRVTGLSLVRDFLQAAVNYYAYGDDKRGLFFTENVRHCIATIPELPRSETNPEDVETNHVPDHAYDVVRYICMTQAGEFIPLTIQGL